MSITFKNARRIAPVPTSRPWFHIIDGPLPTVFVIADSQLLAISREAAQQLKNGSHETVDALRNSVSHAQSPKIPSNPGELTTISLNVAQACNLACGYCYADRGRFGGTARLMDFEVARQSVDRLIKGTTAPRIGIGFMGGEPLLNRALIHRVVEYSRACAAEAGKRIGFGITTNATLITPEDIEMFRDFGFAVTISMDGDQKTHNTLRVLPSGAGSFETAIKAVRPLLKEPGAARVCARVTVSRRTLEILRHFRALLDEGFQEVGVSPLRTSASPDLALRDEDWPILLNEMQNCGDWDWRRIRSSSSTFGFSNLGIALKELYRGTARALPCGAALSYASVSADGDYFTCHRTVGEEKFQIGNRSEGPRHDARFAFLTSRSVDTQEPCSDCWARYLCGGGCHAEVIKNGRSGCDYIRGWLEYCINMYREAITVRPDLFEGGFFGRA